VVPTQANSNRTEAGRGCRSPEVGHHREQQTGCIDLRIMIRRSSRRRRITRALTIVSNLHIRHLSLLRELP